MELGNLKDFYYIIIPIFVLGIIIMGRIKRKKILLSLNLYENKKRNFFKYILIILGISLVFIALLSPQKLKLNEKVNVKGGSFYVLIDISKSMMTKDTYPNRLETAKHSLDEILQGLKGDKIGFIPFSDSAYIQMPLTDDYFMAKNYVDAIDGNLISGGGTELLQALELANRSFEGAKSNDKTVLIVSDGGDYNQNIIEYAKDNKIKVYALGIGTEEGSVIPTKDGFIKDTSGNVVVSKLNGNFLKQLSEETGGSYYVVNNISNGVTEFLKATKNLNKNSMRDEEIKIYEKYYQYPLFLGIIFILFGYSIKRKIQGEEYA